MKRLVSLFGTQTPLFEALNAKAREYALEKNIEYVWQPQNPYDRERVIHLLSESDAGLIDIEPYDEAIFSRIHERCKLLIRFGVGYDKVNLEDADKYGITITRTTQANSKSVAELALTMMLTLNRKLSENQATVRSGAWKKGIGTETIGKTIGIVGFGAIGQCLAKLLQGFECRILAYDPYPNEEIMKSLNVENCTLERLVAESDAISIHVPLCKETFHMFDAERIARMKPNAILICTARGGIIDEEALFNALSQKKIAGAGLDVYAQEPLPTSSDLLKLDNVVLTPHIASQTTEAIWNVYKKAIDIADAIFNGREIDRGDLLTPRK